MAKKKKVEKIEVKNEIKSEILVCSKCFRQYEVTAEEYKKALTNKERICEHCK